MKNASAVLHQSTNTVSQMGQDEDRAGAPVEKDIFICLLAYLNEIDEEEYHAVLQKLLAAKRKSVRAESEYELNGKLVRFALSRGVRNEGYMSLHRGF